MKKILNNPDNFVNEMLEGILAAHPGELKSVSADLKSMVRADAPVKGKVGLATGGGSGHLPVFWVMWGKACLMGVLLEMYSHHPVPSRCWMLPRR